MQSEAVHNMVPKIEYHAFWLESLSTHPKLHRKSPKKIEGILNTRRIMFKDSYYRSYTLYLCKRWRIAFCHKMSHDFQAWSLSHFEPSCLLCKYTTFWPRSWHCGILRHVFRVPWNFCEGFRHNFGCIDCDFKKKWMILSLWDHVTNSFQLHYVLDKL